MVRSGDIPLSPGGRFALSFESDRRRVGQDVQFLASRWMLCDLSDGGREISRGEVKNAGMWTGVLSQDGRLAAIRAMDCTPDANGEVPDFAHRPRNMVIWDTAAAREMFRFPPDTLVSGLVISRDGNHIFAVETENPYKPNRKPFLRLRDAHTGRVLAEHQNDVGSPSPAALSADQRVAVTGGWDRDEAVCVWSLPDFKLIHVLKGHHGTVLHVAISADGRLAFSADGQTIHVWDLSTGKSIHEAKFPSGQISAIACSDDGQWVASSHRGVAEASGSSVTRVWKVNEGGPVNLANRGTEWECLTFAGQSVVLGGNHAVKKVDLPTQISSGSVAQTQPSPARLLWMIRPPKGRDWWKIGTVAFDGSDRVMIGVRDPEDVNFLDIRDAARGQSLSHMQMSLASRACTPVRILPSGKGLVSLGYGEDDEMVAEICEGKSGASRVIWGGPVSNLRTLALSSDGKLAAAGGETTKNNDATFKVIASDSEVWDTATGKTVATIPGNGREVTAIAFSPDGKCVLIASDAPFDNYVGLGHQHPPEWRKPALRLWNIAATKEIAAFTGIEQVRGVAFTPDGTRIIIGGSGGLLCFDAMTLKKIAKIGDPGSINDLAISPDGKRVLTAGTNSNVRLWDITGTREMESFEDHPCAVTSVAFSPDGMRADSGDELGNVCCWRLPSDAVGK